MITKTTNIIWVTSSNAILIDHLSADITAIVSAAVIGDVTYLISHVFVVAVVPQRASRLVFNHSYDFGSTLPVIEDSRYPFDIQYYWSHHGSILYFDSSTIILLNEPLILYVSRHVVLKVWIYHTIWF